MAFQGELGSFSHAAALKLLGPSAVPTTCRNFKQVFDLLQSEAVFAAVIPIENTLHGSVHENYDLLVEYDFPISGETSLRVSHQLVALPGVKLRDVTRAFSHPVALNQCRRFFERYKDIAPVSFYDTAGSVKHIAEHGLRDSAAVASVSAAEIYGGTILRRNIEDDQLNTTRFFLLTKQEYTPPAVGDARKTSIVFATGNKPSALFKALACFALRDLNLTKIESRPLRGKPWEYLFYLDFLGSTDEKNVQRALASLEECTNFCKVLGSYRPTP